MIITQKVLAVTPYAKANTTAKAACGLTLRSSLINELLANPAPCTFIEVAPENWLATHKKEPLQQIANHYQLFAHGLNLDLGGSQPLNTHHLYQIKQFLSDFDISHYSEHMCFSRDSQGYFYELLPLPFTCASAHYIAQRIIQTQDILQQRIAIENITYYTQPHAEMSECEFINEVIQQADCLLLLDVNNLYVNSHNHQYCPHQFLHSIQHLPIDTLHIAGHTPHSSGLLIDSHGHNISTEVLILLNEVYQLWGIKPTILERDHHIPPLTNLYDELHKIIQLQQTITCRNQNNCPSPLSSYHGK